MCLYLFGGKLVDSENKIRSRKQIVVQPETRRKHFPKQVSETFFCVCQTSNRLLQKELQ